RPAVADRVAVPPEGAVRCDAEPPFVPVVVLVEPESFSTPVPAVSERFAMPAKVPVRLLVEPVFEPESVQVPVSFNVPAEPSDRFDIPAKRSEERRVGQECKAVIAEVAA